MLIKKRSEWTDEEVMTEVTNWCVDHDVRGFFKVESNASICGLFLAPAKIYSGHAGRGEELYHVGYTPMYSISESKLLRFFSRENLADQSTRVCISMRMPELGLLEPIDNSEATPYEPENRRLVIKKDEPLGGSVYIPGRKPEYKYNVCYRAPESDSDGSGKTQTSAASSTKSRRMARLHNRSWSKREDDIIRMHFSEYGDDMNLWSRKLYARRRKDIKKRAHELGLE